MALECEALPMRKGKLLKGVQIRGEIKPIIDILLVREIKKVAHSLQKSETLRREDVGGQEYSH